MRETDQGSLQRARGPGWARAAHAAAANPPALHTPHPPCPCPHPGRRFELRKNIPVTLTLQNPSDERVAFKVKTTSPKKYCVRPSSGIVEPKSSKEVQVIMQAQREYPPSFAGGAAEQLRTRGGSGRGCMSAKHAPAAAAARQAATALRLLELTAALSAGLRQTARTSSSSSV